LALLIGMSLVIACGCVINNYIDRGIDAVMTRTKNRALVTAQVPPRHAIIYGVSLGIIGFSVLIVFTNLPTTALGAIGLFFYLVLYSIWKRRSPVGTIVGSVSGATPIVAGYTAVTNHIDGAAVILFLSMVFWQMPHFYAIAMYRLRDYRAAGLPVMPLKKGMPATKRAIIAYTAAFTLAACSLTVFGYSGWVYLVIMASIGLRWLHKGLGGFSVTADDQWGRQMFLFSLLVLLVFCAALSVGALLP
jgi:protoheme IX farnesyltransferase